MLSLSQGLNKSDFSRSASIASDNKDLTLEECTDFSLVASRKSTEYLIREGDENEVVTMLELTTEVSRTLGFFIFRLGDNSI